MRRYFEIRSLDDADIGYIYKRETGRSFPMLKLEMMERYREGYLRRRTDGPYFLRRCMNRDFIEANSHFRVC